VDGLQRRTAALEALRSSVRPRLGATVHFNTSMEWERRRFRILNVAQTKLSPNVLLRNMYLDGSPSLDILHGLSLDSSFPLNRKVNWDQRQHKEHLVSALTFLKSATILHASFQAGLRDTGHDLLVEAFDRFVNKIGHSIVRDNVMLYWKVIDECWGVRSVQVKQLAAHLKLTFLIALGHLVTNHGDFWADTRLVVPRDLRNKLAKFPIHDHAILSLCGTGGHGGARRMLYQMILDHVNTGKRSKRLTPKKNIEDVETVDMRFLDKLAASQAHQAKTDTPN
jgi:hypothetical protein